MRITGLLMVCYFIFGCVGCSALFEESQHSSLKDKSCGCNEVTSTSIRMEYVASPGYHLEMRFNTLDKVYLSWSGGITLVNATTGEIKEVKPPYSSERNYRLRCSVVDADNNTVLAGNYTLKSDSSIHYVVYYVDKDMVFTDITPDSFREGDTKFFRPFFFGSFLYVAVQIEQIGALKPTEYRLLKYDILSGLKLIEDKDVLDIYWGFADISMDNLIWSYNINTRTDPSRIIFSFDGSNYTYYGPGVASKWSQRFVCRRLE